MIQSKATCKPQQAQLHRSAESDEMGRHHGDGVDSLELESKIEGPSRCVMIQLDTEIT